VKILPEAYSSPRIDEGATVMTSSSPRREERRAQEAQPVADAPSNDVEHRLDGIRRDIELALADIDHVLQRARAARDDEQLDAY
jgi:hypothetical protein